MKLTANRDSLLSACKLVSAAVATRPIKPILGMVKAVADGDALTLTAYDTEIGIRYALRGVLVARPGSAILNLPALTRILVECPDDITLDADDRQTRVKTGTCRFELLSDRVDDFPDFPAFDPDGGYHEVKAGDLRQLIHRTSIAAAKRDVTRFALNGILWEAEGNTARLAATDSKRLAVTETAATFYGPAESMKRSHIVPVKAMALLERNLADDGEVVQVALRPNEALFQTERAMIYSRLLEGRYPPYRDIISQSKKSAKVKIPLPVGSFLTHIKQAAIMTDQESKRVDMTFERGRVTMQAQGAETGSSVVEMLLPEYDGAQLRISFDPQYLIEFLRTLDANGLAPVTLETGDGSTPALFHGGEGYVYVVMPLAE